jgi:ribosomal protein S27E
MVSCWLCGKSLAVRRSKDGHLFVSCLDCGMQVFVRSTSGEERLNAKCGGQQP